VSGNRPTTITNFIMIKKHLSQNLRCLLYCFFFEWEYTSN